MPRDGKRSITVGNSTYNKLQKHKTEDETWDSFLSKAAEIKNPMPDIDGSKVKLTDQRWLQLEYIQTFDSGHEVYWWDHAEKFLFLTVNEKQVRDTENEDE